MFSRHLEGRLRLSATQMPVVTLVGPRQSGKTTLVRATFPEHAYVSLEQPDLRALALEDPRSFLARFPGPAIFDEIQRAPELTSYLQPLVDEEPTPGRFVLTGSLNLLLLNQVSQTLAGRTAILRLPPLSLGELDGRPLADPAALVDVSSGASPREIWSTLWSGFYPRIHDRGLAPDRWLADYHRTYVERDLRDVLRVMDLAAFERFMRLVAARTGQLLNLSDLASDVGVSQPTARQWLTALEISFLVAVVQPHHANYRKRVRKQPKLHFLDTGLACYLLGIRDPETLERHPLRGAIFESFVFGELAKAFAADGRDAPLFHWRDSSGHEIDIIADIGERLLPIECKSGLTVASDATRHLEWWLGLDDNPNDVGVLIHGSTDSYRRGPVTVRPWSVW